MASSRPRPVYENDIYDIDTPSFHRISDGSNVPPSRFGTSSWPQITPRHLEKQPEYSEGRYREHRAQEVNDRGQSSRGPDNTSSFHRQYPVQNVGSSSSHQNQSTDEALVAYLQSLVDELRAANNNKSQIIADFQVKFAVQEVELKHATQAKDSIQNSLGLLIQSFSQNFSMGHSSSSALRLQDRATRDATESEINDRKDMEREIEDLRKTNRRLRREAQESQKISERAKLESPIKLEDPREKVRRWAEVSQSNFNPTEPLNRGKKVEFRLDTGRRSSLGDTDPPRTSRTLKIPTWNEASSEDSPPAKPLETSSRPEEIFDSNATTVPLSQPFTEGQDSFISIDELCYDSDDSECREKKRARDVYFQKIPTPGVIKTGIETPGKYLGNDSEFVLSGKTPWNKWGGVRPQNTLPNQFAPPSLQKISSSTSGSPPSEEKPLWWGGSLWNSERERDVAIEIHQRSCRGSGERRLPDLFKHGILFAPVEDGSLFFRTVSISNLPKDVALRDVVARVRGGELFSSFLCDTYPIDRSMTVRIVFKHAKYASDFVNFCAGHPLSFSTESEPIPRIATTTLIETPTYPSNNTRIYQQSRCLCVKNFPSHLSSYELQHAIACSNAFRADALLEIIIDKERTMHLQFASIDAAGSSLGFLNARATYYQAGVVATFWDDPCAGPVNELVTDEGDARKWSKPTFVFGGKAYGGDRNAREMTSQEFFAAANHQRKAEEIMSGGQQRRQLASLTNQKDEIPNMSGKNIGGSSWADEVIEEQEPVFDPKSIADFNPAASSTTFPQPTPRDGTSFSSDTTLSSLDINRLMADPNHKIRQNRKPHPGLAASKYATAIPSYERLLPNRSPSSPSASPAMQSGQHHRGHIVLDYGEDVGRPGFGVHTERVASSEESSDGRSSSSDSAVINLSKYSARKKSVDAIVGDETRAVVGRVASPPLEESFVKRVRSSSSSSLEPASSPSPSSIPLPPSPQRVLRMPSSVEISPASSSPSSPRSNPSPSPAISSTQTVLFKPQPVLVITNPDEIQLDPDSDSDSELEEGEIKEDSD